MRLAEPTSADIAAVSAILNQRDRQRYGARAGSLNATVGFVDEEVLGLGSGTLIALAENHGRPLGAAFFTLSHPSLPYCALLRVNELFVLEGARRDGVGTALIRFLAHFAQLSNCARIEISARRDDARACEFLERLGAEIRDETVTGAFEGDTLAALARRVG